MTEMNEQQAGEPTEQKVVEQTPEGQQKAVNSQDAAEKPKVAEEKKSLEERFFAPPTAAETTFGRKETKDEVEWRNSLGEIIGNVWWIIAIGIVLVILWRSWPTIRQFLDSIPAVDQSKTPLTETIVSSQVIQPTLTGSVFTLTENLSWVNESLFQNVHYYSAGKFVSGKYEGAERIIAVAQGNSERPTKIFTFVRTTNGDVFLDGGKPDMKLWLQMLQSYYLLDEIDQTTQVIQWTDQVTTDHPDSLKLNSTMSLYKTQVLTNVGPYLSLETANRLNVSLDPSQYKALSSLEAVNYLALSLYSKDYDATERRQQMAAGAATGEAELLAATYVQAGTKVLVTDQTGLTFVYELVFSDVYSNYEKSVLEREILNVNLYKEQLVRYVATSQFKAFKAGLAAGQNIGEWPSGLPVAPTVGNNLPGFTYQTNSFEFKAETPLFKRYIPAFLPSCTIQKDAKVLKNVTKQDLTEVGKIFIPQASLYRLTNEGHPLYKLAYQAKFVDTGLTDEEIIAENRETIYTLNGYDKYYWESYDNGRRQAELPTEETYTSTMPLLLLEDPWGRILVLQEGELVTHKECLVNALTE